MESPTDDQSWTFWLGDADWYSDSESDDRVLAAGTDTDGVARATGTVMPALLYVLIPSHQLFVPSSLVSDDANKPYPDWRWRWKSLARSKARQLALELDDVDIQWIRNFNRDHDWFGVSSAEELEVARLLGADVEDELARIWSSR